MVALRKDMSSSLFQAQKKLKQEDHLHCSSGHQQMIPDSVAGEKKDTSTPDGQIPYNTCAYI